MVFVPRLHCEIKKNDLSIVNKNGICACHTFAAFSLIYHGCTSKCYIQICIIPMNGSIKARLCDSRILWPVALISDHFLGGRTGNEIDS